MRRHSIRKPRLIAIGITDIGTTVNIVAVDIVAGYTVISSWLAFSIYFFVRNYDRAQSKLY